jgi:hypothetical protein
MRCSEMSLDGSALVEIAVGRMCGRVKIGCGIVGMDTKESNSFTIGPVLV